MIAFRDVDDQRILQSNWVGAFSVTTEKTDLSQAYGFHKIIKNTVMHHL